MKKVYIIVLLCFSVATGFYFYKANSKKTAYVDVKTVFENFKLKKEIERELEKTQARYKNELDSMAQSISEVYERAKSSGDNAELIAQLKMQQQQFVQKKEQYNGDLTSIVADYDAEIAAKMNGLIQQYAKENGYTYLFGFNGNANILYADSTENVTKDVLTFINSKNTSLWKAGIFS